MKLNTFESLFLFFWWVSSKFFLFCLCRYCLWVLGNEATLVNSRSVWKKLVIDAKDRGCFYNANEDKNLDKAIKGALLELGQIDTLFNMDSLLFKEAKWKVCLVSTRNDENQLYLFLLCSWFISDKM